MCAVFEIELLTEKIPAMIKGETDWLDKVVAGYIA